MTLEGRDENGPIILEPPTKLPEGARVRVEIISSSTEPTLFDRLGHLAGKGRHLPVHRALLREERGTCAAELVIELLSVGY